MDGGGWGENCQPSGINNGVQLLDSDSLLFLESIAKHLYSWNLILQFKNLGRTEGHTQVMNLSLLSSCARWPC